MFSHLPSIHAYNGIIIVISLRMFWGDSFTLMYLHGNRKDGSFGMVNLFSATHSPVCLMR